MSERARTSQILISDRETGLPFSKGLLARTLTATGIATAGGGARELTRESAPKPDAQRKQQGETDEYAGCGD